MRGFNWVNDAASSINITASRVDADMTDVVNGFNLCLTRDGQGKVSTDFDFNGFGGKNLKNGSAASPAVVFQSSTTGFYLISTTQLGVSVGGTLRATFDNTGALTMTGAISGVGFTDTGTSTLTTVNVTNAVTGASFIPTGSSVPANGMYLSAANTVAFSSNTTLRGSVNSTGNWVLAAPGSGTSFLVNGVGGNNVIQASSNTNGNPSGLVALNSNAGASSYGQLQLTGGTNNKYLRCGASGNTFDIVNSAYSAVIFSIADAGGTTIGTAGQSNQVNGTTQYSDGTTNAEIGWRSLPNSSFTGTLTAAHRSRSLSLTGGVTVPNAVFSAGDVVLLINTSGSSQTITQGSSLTLTLGGTATSGNRTIAVNGIATILFTSPNGAYAYGPGVS